MTSTEFHEIPMGADKHAAPCRPSFAPNMTKEMSRMLLHEELARARIREFHLTMEDQQTVRFARAARRWDRVSRWAARRSRRYRR